MKADMKAEKTIMITGKLYSDIKGGLDDKPSIPYNIGTSSHPQIVNITGIYLDTDPDFTRNSGQFARIDDSKHVQVKIEYEAE